MPFARRPLTTPWPCRSYSIDLTPFFNADFSIAAADPESIGAMIRTLAPSATHWSACVFCFCGSPCAFTTRAATPAALNAFCSAGRSNCSQRTDVFVSGISPQMVTPALLLLELALALATTTAATTPTTPSSRTGDLRKTFVTAHSFTLVFVRRMAPCPVSRRLTAHRAAAMPVHSVKISDSVPAVKCEARWNVPSPLHPGGPRPCPRMETLSKISYDAASLSLEKQERLI